MVSWQDSEATNRSEVLRVGVLLPHFGAGMASLLDAARQAEDLGLDGVFVYDHAWPPGHPDGPAFSALPLAAAIAARTDRIAVGTLVARVSLLPLDVLAASLAGLGCIAPGRFIAGIGTGDKMSRPEHDALGIPWLPASTRRDMMRTLAHSLVEAGIPVWTGIGGAVSGAWTSGNLEAARLVGAVPNCWQAPVEVLAEIGRGGPVTWGGSLPGDVAEVARQLGELARAHSSWAVATWPQPGVGLEGLAAARALASESLGGS